MSLHPNQEQQDPGMFFYDGQCRQEWQAMFYKKQGRKATGGNVTGKRTGKRQRNGVDGGIDPLEPCRLYP
jgi:hypothetical protein